MTPVSYPNNSPPRVAMTVSLVRNLAVRAGIPGMRDMGDPFLGACTNARWATRVRSTMDRSKCANRHFPGVAP